MPNTYNKKNHDIMMVKYYGSEVGQKKLIDQIIEHKEQIKIFEDKIRDLQKYQIVQTRVCDIEQLSERALVCAKVDCDFRLKKQAASLLPVLQPHPQRPVTGGRLISYTDGSFKL